MRVFAARHSGFTLLEILVVVSLIAIMSLVILTQTNWVNDDKKLEQETARLKDTVSLLNERSLFSGDLMALLLRDDGWTPMVYDREQHKFVAVQITGLKAHDLPSSLELSWQLDELADDQQVSLQDVARKLVKKDAMASDNMSDGKDTKAPGKAAAGEDDSSAFPQIFFFPSGEVSPVTFNLHSRDGAQGEQRLALSALGHISDPEQPPETSP
ncbi:MAG: prepilin-type N-terminal cleavage/methylation domain-containing protein [Alcanivorax sp.]|nr:prepilin-type N-terminal cleavage/methylation domain-containing protein [Alcanivorax sp.]